jgi:hypothetical protein
MNQEAIAKDIDALVAKYDAMKKRDKMDLSSDQDLTVAIMNLVGIEEHFFFTGAKTGNDKYYDLILEVRNMRKELLQKIIKDYEGEVWCISKHLLAASYRLMEVGTKQLDLENKQEAYNFFAMAYKLYSLFWGLQMKLVPVDNIKKIDEQALSKGDKKGDGVTAKLGVLIQKVINCCIE